MNETICAIATPPGRGAIAVVRICGPQARTIASRLFVSREKLMPRTATYGTIVDEHGLAIDRGIALFWPAPHGYTGEDTVELQTHGSPVVAQDVVRAAVALGARLARAGEFSERAFLNGKLNLSQANAVADLIDAQSRAAARAAAANLAGGVRTVVLQTRARLTHVLEELSGAIDFPEEVSEPPRARVERDVRELRDELAELVRRGEAGRLVREGVSVAIVGAPNAGKSSLLNALLRDDRAIVSEIAGTTRDTIEETFIAGGIAFRLIDTAGIRARAECIEAAGIERSRRALAGARLALVVVDASVPLSHDARTILELTGGSSRVVFANKADLGRSAVADLAVTPDVIGSTRDATTIADVEHALSSKVTLGLDVDLERPHLAALYELDAARAAVAALDHALRTLHGGDALDFIVGDLQRAHSELGHISGDIANEEIVAGVFARFCIGK